MFKQYKYMNDSHVYSIRTYEKQISYDYYCQIMTHEVCDDSLLKGMILGSQQWANKVQWLCL
jgi:hypothetical protein